jgi:hypothetical protein
MAWVPVPFCSALFMALLLYPLLRGTVLRPRG